MTENFAAWIGKTETISDTIEPTRSNACRAALGDVSLKSAGDEMPLLHHWLYFWNVQPPSGLGPDGHPAKGGFLPPIPLPRRMWAGGRLQFFQSLRLAEAVTKTSTILAVTAKEGKSGKLIFVTVEHRIAGENGDAIIEEQDLVYKDASPAGPAMPATGVAHSPSQYHVNLPLDEVSLFRYSALTMNGHRIHYDLPYAREEEAYPALVIHGPLQATILAHNAMRHLGRPLKRFEFRGASPAFCGVNLDVCCDLTEVGATLWTEQGGTKCMTATAV